MPTSNYAGRPDYLENDLTRFTDATPASVSSFVREHMGSGRVVSHIVPGEPESIAPVLVATPPPDTEQGAVSMNADEPWRSEQPPRGATRAAGLPVPQSFQLPNGSCPELS